MIVCSTLLHSGSRWFSIALLIGLLTGCSSTQLAYRQLDWALVWWVEDYIPLNNVQEARLETQINSLLDWHCRHELPRYVVWLEDVKTLAMQPPISTVDVERRQADLIGAIDRLTRQIHPTATQLLASLDDEQVEALGRAMAEGQEERREEFLGGSPDDQIRKREERTRERAERWLGPLTSAQVETLQAWNRARGDQTRIWLEGRGRWQQALMDSLEHREAGDFPGRIEQLVVGSSEVRGEAYQAMLAEAQIAMAQLITDLINQSTPEQRNHLEDEIDELQADFEALACSSGDVASEDSDA